MPTLRLILFAVMGLVATPVIAAPGDATMLHHNELDDDMADMDSRISVVESNLSSVSTSALPGGLASIPTRPRGCRYNGNYRPVGTVIREWLRTYACRYERTFQCQMPGKWVVIAKRWKPCRIGGG